MPKKRKPTEPTDDRTDEQAEWDAQLQAFAAEYGDAVVEKLRRVMAANPETGKAWTWADIQHIQGRAGISESEKDRMSLRDMVARLQGVLDMKQAEAVFLAKAIREGLDAAVHEWRGQERAVWSKPCSKTNAAAFLGVSVDTINNRAKENPGSVEPISRQLWRFDKRDPLFESLP